MIKLYGRIRASRSTGEPLIVRLTSDGELDSTVRQQHAYLLPNVDLSNAPRGFAATVSVSDGDTPLPGGSDSLHVELPQELGYLGPGDIVRLNTQAREVRVLYRVNSPHNSLFVTERCNSNCIMCSQPPKDVDDSFLVQDLLHAIPLMSPETRELGITGGEPTLLGEKLCQLISACREHLPETGLHVLSNGRLFAYLPFAHRMASIGHPDLMFGIPLYSDLAHQHDFVVQAKGAFDQTIRGLLNLGRTGVKTEIRVVIHDQTYSRLPQLAEFIARNLPFVSHIALMGLEMMGYVKMNLGTLWIDPVKYQRELSQCVHTLDEAGLSVSIYNHQLCVLDRSLWPYARQSISDWKNEYLDVCQDCSVRDHCGGFFASAKLRYSDYIQPIPPDQVTCSLAPTCKAVGSSSCP